METETQPAQNHPAPSEKSPAFRSRTQAGENATSLESLTCCPRCRSVLIPGSAIWLCSNRSCAYSDWGFPIAAGQPVLIDFERSIFERAAYADGRGSVLRRDDSARALRTRLRAAILGSNPVALRLCQKLLQLVKARRPYPIILVIGGGAIGDGTEPMHRDPEVRIIVTDVYASPNTCLLADGHQLPFPDGTFDAVWIQAVLEHVLEPQRVVDEIHRVLNAGGLVYADTPFMQQVHEGAYDFTRFTQSGHRWLFRRFDEIEAGAANGAGVALVWSIRYFARALGAPDRLSTLISLPFAWLRFLDGLAKRRPNADAASGIYFLGTRSESELPPKKMVSYYGGPPA